MEHCVYCAGYGFHQFGADTGFIQCHPCGGKITRTKEEFVGPERRQQYKECNKHWEAKKKADSMPRRRTPIAQVVSTPPVRRRIPIGKV